jgi:hypothetical protein
MKNFSFSGKGLSLSKDFSWTDLNRNFYLMEDFPSCPFCKAVSWIRQTRIFDRDDRYLKKKNFSFFRTGLFPCRKTFLTDLNQIFCLMSDVLFCPGRTGLPEGSYRKIFLTMIYVGLRPAFPLKFFLGESVLEGGAPRLPDPLDVLRFAIR